MCEFSVSSSRMHWTFLIWEIPGDAAGWCSRRSVKKVRRSLRLLDSLCTDTIKKNNCKCKTLFNCSERLSRLLLTLTISRISPRSRLTSSIGGVCSRTSELIPRVTLIPNAMKKVVKSLLHFAIHVHRAGGGIITHLRTCIIFQMLTQLGYSQAIPNSHDVQSQVSDWPHCRCFRVGKKLCMSGYILRCRSSGRRWCPGTHNLLRLWRQAGACPRHRYMWPDHSRLGP